MIRNQKDATAKDTWTGDYANRDVLIEAARICPEDTVLDLGWEGRSIVPGHMACTSCFLTTDLRAYDLFLSQSPESLPDKHYATLATDISSAKSQWNVVLYRPTIWSAKGRVFEMIDQAFERMSAEGRFFLAGRKQNGVISYAKRLKAVFGNTEVIRKAGGLRVYCAQKVGKPSGVPSMNQIAEFEYRTSRGESLTFETRPGVFSRDGLDPGSEFLLDNLVVQTQDRILDIGCGCGVLGIVGGRLADRGHSVMVDSDLLAVECSQRNIIRNGLKNVRAVLSDGVDAISDGPFDLILSNPPTHEGGQVARRFVHGASLLLAPGGRFIVVVKRSRQYLSHMTEEFSHVSAELQKDGYQIIEAYDV
jgi:16S rRNA (guanine1207-N2)-methyltransferase